MNTQATNYKASEKRAAQPMTKNASGYFAEQILADLISKGYSGAELLAEFKEAQRKVRPSVEKMLSAAKRAAEGKGEYFTYGDVFATGETDGNGNET